MGDDGLTEKLYNSWCKLYTLATGGEGDDDSAEVRYFTLLDPFSVKLRCALIPDANEQDRYRDIDRIYAEFG